MKQINSLMYEKRKKNVSVMRWSFMFSVCVSFSLFADRSSIFVFKHLSTRRVNHFLDVYSRSVVCRSSDLPFESRIEERCHVFLREYFLLCTLCIDMLEQQLDEKRNDLCEKHQRRTCVWVSYRRCLFVSLVCLNLHSCRCAHGLILSDVLEPW